MTRMKAMLSIMMPLLIGAIATMWPSRSAYSQATPFFGSGQTTSQAQISTVTDGSNLTISRAVVSHDRKYVTLDISPQMDNFLGFNTFSFQTAGMGFVGSSTAIQGMNRAIAQSRAPSLGSQSNQNNSPLVAQTPTDVAAMKPTVLDVPGMNLIAPLQPLR